MSAARFLDFDTPFFDAPFFDAPFFDAFFDAFFSSFSFCLRSNSASITVKRGKADSFVVITAAFRRHRQKISLPILVGKVVGFHPFVFFRNCSSVFSDSISFFPSSSSRDLSMSMAFWSPDAMMLKKRRKDFSSRRFHGVSNVTKLLSSFVR